MPTSQFQFFGIPHISAIVLTVAIPLALATMVRRSNSPRVTGAVCYLLGATLLANEVGHWGYRLLRGEFQLWVQEYLPLHVCGLTVFVIAFALFFRNQMLYEIAYFWGLVGTLNAILTPELEVGFPRYRFFQYFVAHSGIVIGILFATWGLRMRPTFRGLLRSFLLINLCAVVIAGLDLVLGTNYMFLCAPPATASPFFFAPWPWYIPILEGVAFVFFCVAYLPFGVNDWRQRPRQLVESENELINQ